MWNYRVVRKKHIHVDSTDKKEKVDYTYAIHEAYYDKRGHVGTITSDPVEPFGENIEELRHSWVMMAEAFGQAILDYDNIPEPGYERRKDPLGAELDKRIKELETGTAKLIPWERVKRDLGKNWSPFDEKGYRKRVEQERIEKERIHGGTFVGTPTIEKLIEKIYSDYREYIQRGRTGTLGNTKKMPKKPKRTSGEGTK